MPHLDVTARNGVPFRVVVERSDLRNRDTVAFYDLRWMRMKY